MNINPHGYLLIDWERVCDQCDEIQAAHDKASDSAEYGINLYEFIHTSEDDLHGMAERWWIGLSAKRREKLLQEKAESLRANLAAIECELNIL